MFAFLQNLDPDIQQSLLMQLRDLWTHTSTALEGNTLTLGDTKFVLDEGLTVSGKPIKDHQEVIGHAKAIEIIYSLIGRDITEKDLFALHKAVQSEIINDIHKPYGDWKVEPNGTYAVDENGKQVYIEYASPKDVPVLMEEVIKYTNNQSRREISEEDAPAVYAKLHMGIVHVHPFWDGNGRIARLVANIPLLNSGLPPLVIAKETRRKYIDTLASYQRNVGTINKKTGVWPDNDKLVSFSNFCANSYKTTIELIEKARKQQSQR